MALPIGGFMPIPLAMMIPFMATQSMVMGDAFGRAFQYGKRKISAMTNEEFNATTLEQQASEMFQSYKNIIPSLNQGIKDSTALQKIIIDEMLLILPRFLAQTGTDAFGGTDIKTPIEDHPHSIDRSHIHSEESGKASSPTITGTTTANGITTTHWSDGTTTTSGTATPPKQTNQQLIDHYTKNVADLKTLIIQLQNRYTSVSKQVPRNSTQQAQRQAGLVSLANQRKVAETELKQQQLFLSRVKRGENPY